MACVDEREGDCDKGQYTENDAVHIEVSGLPIRALLYENRRRDDRKHHDRYVDEKYCAPAEAGNQRSAEQRTGRKGHTSDSCPNPNRFRLLATLAKRMSDDGKCAR